MTNFLRGFPFVIAIGLAFNTAGWERAVFIGLLPACIDVIVRYRRD